MIGKIKKGKSFGGCIRYVMGKDNAEIIASDGVLLGSNREMIDSFNCQCLLNPKIKQSLGHIALSFKPEDAPRLTDEFMTNIALEYMDLMGIKNTQFIVVDAIIYQMTMRIVGIMMPYQDELGALNAHQLHIL